jgi:hypothetical protein
VGKSWLGILFVSISLLGGGCGDDHAATTSESTGSTTRSSTSAASDGPLTPAQFAATATKLCDEARLKYIGEAADAFLKIRARNKRLSRLEAEAKVMETTQANALRKRVDTLRALGIPKSEKQQIEEVLAAIEAVADKAQKHPKKFVYQQSHFKHPFFKARHLANRYGIGHCAR